MSIHRCTSFVLVGALIAVNQTHAITTDVAGQTSSISNGFTAIFHPEGSHFHSSNLTELPPGNPDILLPGVAEVGGFFGDEEIRGVSEFELQNAAEKATLLFDVLDLFELGLSPESSGIDGLFGESEQRPLVVPRIGQSRYAAELFDGQIDRLGAGQDRFDDVGSQEN